MKVEKAIKQQARDALRGNFLPLIAGLGLIFTLIFALYYGFETVLLATNAIDPNTEELNASGELPYYLAVCGTMLAATLLSPFINGFLYAAGKTAVEKHCSASDLFYYFRGGFRWFKTMIIDLLLFLWCGVLTAPLRLVSTLDLFGDDPAGVALNIAFNVFGVIWTVLVYALFAHWPLCAYALDSSKGILHCSFGYIGFSFRHLGKLLKLTFSLFGWILLCFFVAPAIYVIPYAAVCYLNSARWLIEK